MSVSDITRPPQPWNKDKLVGQKSPLKVRTRRPCNSRSRLPRVRRLTLGSNLLD